MLSQNEAQKILDALDFFSQFKEANAWEGMPRASLFNWLIDFFQTDNLPEIRRTLEEISSGAISPNTIPLEVLESAKERGISREDLEVKIQKQRSNVKEWINSIAKTKTPEQSVATQVKAAEAAAKIERDAKISTPTEKIPAEKPEVVEEVLIPVTGTETYKAEVGQAPQAVQIKFDSKQPIDQAERINATQPFFVAAEKIKNSEDIDLNSSFSLIGNGISSKKIESASKSLPGSTRSSILRISKTMNDIERIFPDKISRIRDLISVENLEVQIAKIDFTPSANGILLNPNINPYGGYTAIGGSSELGVIGDFAKNKVLDLASDKILSKVQGAIGDKLTKGAIGKAVSSLGQKLASTAIGKAISAIGAKIGAALGFLGGPLVAAITAIIGAIISAIAGWIMEKLGPLLQKIKDWAKKASRAALATAATIILLPFTLFISSIALPFLIILITLPISVALILFIINSGAYVVPPKIGMVLIPSGAGYDCKDAGQLITAPGAQVQLLPDSNPARRQKLCITPTEIVIHWSGGWNGVTGTYNTLVGRGRACQFATDELTTLQMQQLWEKKVEWPICAGSHNDFSINIEMSGSCFSNCSGNTTPPPESEIKRTVDLVCWLKKQYNIKTIIGHYEIPNSGKTNPGKDFLYKTFLPRVNTQCPN